MARKFGKIDARLWRSRKFAALADDSLRLTYVWLLTCRHGNGTGIFTIPAMYLATELSCGLDEAEARLDALEAVGLIERAPDEVIRIVGWFRVANAPRTPSIAVGVAKSLSEVSDTGTGICRSHAILELLAAILAMCGGWDQETQTFNHMIRTAHSLLASEIERDREQTQQAAHNLRLSLSDICRAYGVPMPDKKENENENENESENKEQRRRTEIENRDREQRTEIENREQRTEKRATGGAQSIADMVADLSAKAARSKI